MFYAAPLPHQSGLRPASFPGGEAFVPGFGVQGFVGNGSVLKRAERHIGRSLRFLVGVLFNLGILRTGVYGVAFLRVRFLLLECFRHPYTLLEGKARDKRFTVLCRRLIRKFHNKRKKK